MSHRSLEDSLRQSEPGRAGAQLADRAYVYPKVPAEFSNWRDEQRAWRETCALFDQSHHMTDLYVEGPDVIPLFSRLGVNTFRTSPSTRRSNSSPVTTTAM